MFDSVMKALEADFQVKWVDMMSQHHLGAIEMAPTETDRR